MDILCFTANCLIKYPNAACVLHVLLRRVAPCTKKKSHNKASNWVSLQPAPFDCGVMALYCEMLATIPVIERLHLFSSQAWGGWRLDITDIWISHIWTSSYIWMFMSKCKLYPKVKFLYIQRISVSKNENKQYPKVKYVQKRDLMSKCKKTTHDKSILIKSIQSELAINRDVSAVRQLVTYPGLAIPTGSRHSVCW